MGHRLRGIDRHRGQGHGPGFGVHPLKRRGLPECNGLARGFRAVEACAGRCRFIGQINKIDHRDPAEQLMGQRVALEELCHPQSDGDNHKGKSQNNPGRMGQSAPRAEIGSSGHKHQVVGSGCDRGDKAKEHETGQQRICHGPLVSPLRAKFNDPSGQILGKKTTASGRRMPPLFAGFREEKAYCSDPRPQALAL